MKDITQETINQLANSSCPERLCLETKPPINDDHVAHIVQLTQSGQTSLAADHLLFPEMKGGSLKRCPESFDSLASASMRPDPLRVRQKKPFIEKYASDNMLMKHYWRWLSISMASRVAGSIRGKRKSRWDTYRMS